MGVIADNLPATEWRYNGVAPMDEILSWCKQTLIAHTYGYYGWETIYFFDKSAYVLFLMRWA
jgi:hypothetical protein